MIHPYPSTPFRRPTDHCHAGVLRAPSVARPANSSVHATYHLLLIDQDVPLNSTAKTTLLHWFAPNLTSTADNSTLRLTNAASAPAGGAPVGAPYQSPTPPAGSGPHRYTFVLFAQPANFSVPASYGNVNPPNESSARRGFNVTDFVGASGLAAPLAANYLRVLNGTAEETSSAIPTTGTMVMTGSATASASATAGSSASTAGAAEGWGTGGSVGSWLLGAVGALLWMV